jgi:hypothetical protein
VDPLFNPAKGVAMQNSQRTDEPFKDFRQNISAAIGLCQALAMPARLFWTRWGTAGELFFGGRLAFIGWLSIAVWAAFSPPQDAGPMLQFWGLTTFLLLAHRARHFWLRRKGYRAHSQYGGDSVLERLGGARFAKQVWEPLLTALCGRMCLDWSRPLGSYLLCAAVAMAVAAAFSFETEASARRRLRDAKHEQEWLAARMQEEDVD